MEEEKLLEEIFEWMDGRGWREGTEQYEICKQAVRFRNFSYKRSEELESGTTVDCSTLTSQSHWEGALIGIPFVADSQRKAASGKFVSLSNDMIPADVLVKYPSLEASPDKTWNHVGLYLGRDKQGTQWLIESTSKTGVRLSTVEAFDPQGGIKRFTLETQPFDSLTARRALALAPLVPKFGRLGVRQYRKSGEGRPAHRGLDLYMLAGTPVYATIAGSASRIHESLEDANGIEVVGKNMTVRYLMLGSIAVEYGVAVQVGDLLGYVISPSQESEIVYSSLNAMVTHLHLEIELTAVNDTSFPTEIVVEGKRYANHLYLSKIGRLSLPFRS